MIKLSHSLRSWIKTWSCRLIMRRLRMGRTGRKWSDGQRFQRQSSSRRLKNGNSLEGKKWGSLLVAKEGLASLRELQQVQVLLVGSALLRGLQSLSSRKTCLLRIGGRCAWNRLRWLIRVSWVSLRRLKANGVARDRVNDLTEFITILSLSHMWDLLDFLIHEQTLIKRKNDIKLKLLTNFAF